MRHPADIQKIEREKRQKRSQEICEIASPLNFKRKMKPTRLTTMPKDPPVSRESRIEEDMGKAPTEEPIDVPKYLPMLREI